MTRQQICIIDAIVKSQFTIAQLNNQGDSIQLLREGAGETPSLLPRLSDSIKVKSLKRFYLRFIKENFKQGVPDDVKHFNNPFLKCSFIILSDYLLDKELIAAHRGGQREEKHITQLQTVIDQFIRVSLSKKDNTHALFNAYHKRQSIIAYREIMYLLQAIQAYMQLRLPVNITIGLHHRKTILRLAKDCFGINPAVINTVSLNEACTVPTEPLALAPLPCPVLKEQFLKLFPRYSRDLWRDPTGTLIIAEHSTGISIMGLLITLIIMTFSTLSSCFRTRRKRGDENIKSAAYRVCNSKVI